MALDLSQHTPDQIAELMVWLPELPTWPAEDAKAVLVALAGSTQKLDWGQFQKAGPAWAQAENGSRLLEDARQAFEGTQHDYVLLFEKARFCAMGARNVPLFAQLAHPNYGWTPTEQVYDWIKLNNQTRPAPELMEVFWAYSSTDPQRVRELYQALARETMDLEKSIQNVLAFHAQNPVSLPEALHAGFSEALYYTQILMAISPIEDATLLPCIETLMAHMKAEELLEGLKVHAEKEGELSDFGMGLYHEVCDRILPHAMHPTQDAWLARPSLSLPRTRAMIRERELTQRPVARISRPRPRS